MSFSSFFSLSECTLFCICDYVAGNQIISKCIVGTFAFAGMLFAGVISRWLFVPTQSTFVSCLYRLHN